LVDCGASTSLRPALVGISAIVHIAAADTRAPSGPITIAEVTAGAGAGSSRLANVTDLLRHDVEAELSAINWAKLGIRRRYTISASLVRLESTTTGAKSLLASCTVSVAVRDSAQGTILAIVEGRARAEDMPAAAAAAERDALAGAARGAITAVPEAIKRSQ